MAPMTRYVALRSGGAGRALRRRAGDDRRRRPLAPRPRPGPAQRGSEAVHRSDRPMRARYPDQEGFVERNGVKVAYEVYGDSTTAVLLVPPSPITHPRTWKGLIPYLSRHVGVVTSNGRGTGRSDRPHTAGVVRTRRDRSRLGQRARRGRRHPDRRCRSLPRGAVGVGLAADHIGRIAGVVAMRRDRGHAAPRVHRRARAPVAGGTPRRHGWGMRNRGFWRQQGGYRSWVQFFFDEQLPEPHSTKQYEDTVSWALDTEVEAMIAEREGRGARASRPRPKSSAGRWTARSS